MVRLDTVMKRISRVLAYIAALCTMAIMVVIILDLAFRTITGRSLVGAFEVVVMLVVCVVFLGLPYAERSGTAVRVTLLTDRLGARSANVVRLVAMAFALIVTCWFTWASYGSLGSSVSGHEYMAGLVKFPTWPMRIMISIGFTILCLVLLQAVLERVIALGVPSPARSALQVDEFDDGVSASSTVEEGKS
ncbi:TRAP transporter small permease subunit [Rhodococcus artemisiae]|uniref:TRAP transporter small permease n=1 Tax=Rhodococcus artemisiae TaxID=714159 RepID=A0ABU7LFY2_9NOCA|nr:TRAP transporter small permease [Rhodococcus artemisiae]MEE2060451.1 TRAP transporter small permease [Rhodococcus artemisiae]